MTTATSNTGAPSRALFVRLGHALYGPSWQHAMAEALGVSPRTVRYWVAGRAIPASVWGDVDALLSGHAARLEGLRVELGAK